VKRRGMGQEDMKGKEEMMMKRREKVELK